MNNQRLSFVLRRLFPLLLVITLTAGVSVAAVVGHCSATAAVSTISPALTKGSAANVWANAVPPKKSAACCATPVAFAPARKIRHSTGPLATVTWTATRKAPKRVLCTGWTNICWRICQAAVMARW